MKKKKNVCLLVLVAVLVAVAIAMLFLPQNTQEIVEENNEQNELQEKTEKEADSIESVDSENVRELNKEDEAVNAILIGKKTFTDFESGKEATIFTLPMINNDYHKAGAPIRYAVVDLDNNGTEELLVEYSIVGDTAILNFEEEKIVAYYIPFRGRQEVKTDGSLHWSSSATESGVQKVSFEKTGMVLKDVLVYRDELYMLEGKEVSKEECESAFRKEWEKSDVEWYLIL